ncbi:MAG: NVEALA domain-containing protein [Tannerellaceae bacterium]|nr:NVEALA domain-containing protein [Tannerellaceae bacterium]
MHKRKKIFFALLVMVCIGIYSFNKKKYTDTNLINVEALAAGEGGAANDCYYPGSVYCAGMRVDYSGSLR